jgi:hypothetical protein
MCGYRTVYLLALENTGVDKYNFYRPTQPFAVACFTTPGMFFFNNSVYQQGLPCVSIGFCYSGYYLYHPF